MPELMTRPFLTASEQAGLPRAQADLVRAQASSAEAKSFSDWSSLGDQFQQKADMNTLKAEQDVINNAEKQRLQVALQPGGEFNPAPAPAAQPSMQAPTAPPEQEASAQAQPVQIAQAPAPVDASLPGAPQQRALPQQTAPAPVGPQVAAPQQAAPAPVQAAPQAAAAPQTAVQATPQVAAAAPQDAAQTPQVMPATKVEIPPASQITQTLRGNTVIGGKPNLLADDVLKARADVIQNLVANGQIRASTGEAYMNNIQAARDKQLANAVELREKIAKIEGMEGTANEKRLEVAKAARGVQDNNINLVYQAFKKGDIPGAQQIAKEVGLGEIDFSKPGTLTTLETRAKRSDDYQSIGKENRAQADSDANRNAVKTDGLPDGFFRIGKNSPQIYKQGDNGQPVPVSTSEMQQAKVAQNAPFDEAVTDPNGQVSIVKVDKQGNRFIPPNLQKQYGQMDANAKNAISTLPAVRAALGKDPQTGKQVTAEGKSPIDLAPSSGVGNATSDLATWLGTKGDATKAREVQQRAIEQGLSAVAAIDPRAKGAPSNADIEGIKKGLTDPNSSPESKRASLARLETILTNMVSERDDSLSNLNDESKARLRGTGVSASDDRSRGSNPSSSGVSREAALAEARRRGLIK